MGQSQIKEKSKYNLLIPGKRIYLRDLRISDANKNYCKWMNDKEINQYLESRFEKWSIKKLRHYVRKMRKDPNCIIFAIISKDKDKHIGNIKIRDINRFHKFAYIGIVIGEKAYWGKGFATEAIKLVVGYTFNKLKLNKLIAGSYAANPGSIKAFKKAGFSVEGVIKKHYLCNGKYTDGVLLGIVDK